MRHNIQNLQTSVHVDITSYLQIVIKIFILQSKSINFSILESTMQLVNQIDSKLAQTVPYYSNVSAFAVGQCKTSFDALLNFYECSEKRVKNITKASKQFKKDLIWMVSQSTDDFLQLLQEKLEIQCSQADEKNRMKRVINICKELTNIKLNLCYNRVITFNKDIYSKGKLIGERYFIPIYLPVKATVIVSKQILMEIFEERILQLRMKFRSSKDTITMFLSGEFKQEKIIQQVKQNFGSLKQLTVNFVQKGLEIKISKKQLAKNYHHIMNMLSEIVRDVSQKSIVQLKQTKTKTVNLYKQVLSRIRQKQIEIKTKIKKEKLLQKYEASGEERKNQKQTNVSMSNQNKPEAKSN